MVILSPYSWNAHSKTFCGETVANSLAAFSMRSRVERFVVRVINSLFVCAMKFSFQVLDTVTAPNSNASVAFQVLICVRVQPLLLIAEVVAVGVTVPQLSFAVAVPSAASIVAAVGLQPKLFPFATDPVAVMTGAIVSTVQLIVLETASAALPQASVAFHVLI